VLCFAFEGKVICLLTVVKREFEEVRFKMSSHKDRFHQVTEQVYRAKPAGLVIRKIERTKAYDELEPSLAMLSVENAPRPTRVDSIIANPNWMFDEERNKYRHASIEKLLDDVIDRKLDEDFDSFLERSYSTANVALNANGKAIVGDECEELVDRWVMRFVKGFKLLSRKTGVGFGPEEENLLFKLVREECDILTKQDIVFVTSRQSVRDVKRPWSQQGYSESHPTDYREGVGAARTSPK